MAQELTQLIDQLQSGSLTLHEMKGHQDDRTKDIPKFTTCRVFTLNNEKQEIVGYYKEEKYGLFGGALMNEIAFDIAKILGLEQRILPTAKIEPFSNQGQSYKGGAVQAAQDGITLYDYQHHPDQRRASILLDEYIESILSSVILGMFDAHSHNILIDPSGKIHFFDLTRSLPHANTLLDRGGYLGCPYECNLLAESENSSILSLKKRKEIQQRLKEYQVKLGDVKNYLKSPEVKEKISQLPEFWFSPGKVYRALTGRIDNLLHAFEDHHIQQVRDLAFSAFPYFKFICLLNYCMLLDWRSLAKDEFLLNRCLREIDHPIFFHILPAPIEGMIDECIKLGLDPLKIYACSKEETLTKSMSCIVQHVQEKLIHPETPVEMAFLSQQGEILKNDLKKVSEVDWKDWGEDYPDEDFFNS